MSESYRVRQSSCTLVRNVAVLMAAVLVLLALFPMGSWARPDQNAMRQTIPLPDVTVTFQELVSPEASYAGVADTYISLYEPSTNYGSLATMKVHSQAQRERLLVKFDISRIPPSTNIVSATMGLFAWYRSQAYRQTASAYRVLRHWNELEATWNAPTTSALWGQPGAN